MEMPDEEQCDQWIEAAEQQVELDRAELASGQAAQDLYTSMALSYATLGRARLLRGDSLTLVREALRQAAIAIETSFVMAYDSDSPLFLGDRADYAEVSELDAIEGLNWALMCGDIDLAQRMAARVRPRPDDRRLIPEVHNYAFAYRHMVMDEPESAVVWLERTLDRYRTHLPPRGYKLNYYSLSLTLAAIGIGDHERFASGLAWQLQCYRDVAASEKAGTPEAWVSDHAVALGNLAVACGFPRPQAAEFLPGALLLTADEPIPAEPARDMVSRIEQPFVH